MKRLLVISFLLSTWLFSFITPKPIVANAQDTAIATSPIWDDSLQRHTDDLSESNQKGVITGLASYTQLQISAIVSSLGVLVMGYQPGENGTPHGGAVQFFANGVDFLISNPPASSIDYIAYMSRQLHFPGTPTVAYAAAGESGLGFSKLTPILPIWALMRNVAYIIFAVIFVVAGLMIMFRVKIDPKTAASVQSALPKVVLALLLVTFSYAIAGFLIDLMYVALGLIITLMSSLAGVGTKPIKELLSGSIFAFVFNGGWYGTTLGVAQAVYLIVDDIFKGSINGGLIGAASSILGLVLSGLAFLIVGIAILWALFKTWLSLIGAYAGIILSIIFAPLQLMLDAIPGQNQFTSWLRGMLANLLAFPLVVILLSVGSAIATNFGKGISPADPAIGFVPPLLGAGTQQTVQAFIGLGILLTIPKAVDILRELLKAPMFKYGTAWAENLSVGTGAAGALGGGIYGRAVGPAQARYETYQEAERKSRIIPGSPAPNPISRWDRLAGRMPKAK